VGAAKSGAAANALAVANQPNLRIALSSVATGR
jgi:hypothetical protein